MHPESKIYRLEQNYDLPKYLDVASHLISHNKDRLGKKLWSDMIKVIW